MEDADTFNTEEEVGKETLDENTEPKEEVLTDHSYLLNSSEVSTIDISSDDVSIKADSSTLSNDAEGNGEKIVEGADYDDIIETTADFIEEIAEEVIVQTSDTTSTNTVDESSVVLLNDDELSGAKKDS